MSTSLLRNSSARAALLAASSTSTKRAGLAGASFVRTKATLPDLACTCSSTLSFHVVLIIRP